MTITEISAQAYRIPTDAPEADGTLDWDATTIIVVRVSAGGTRGLGYTYCHEAAAGLLNHHLAGVVSGCDPMAVRASWDAMVRSVRNMGLGGVAAYAISAVDAALWDLKARLLGLPLARLLGAVRRQVPIYGSGGFTSYTPPQFARQLGGWAAQGIRAVKMKVGGHPGDDAGRVAEARKAIGPETALFVDANGAFDRPTALALARDFAAEGVTWFEEPVSSDDLRGLRAIRERVPPGMAVAAGEYGTTPWYFRAMLDSGAVDILQADATRCLGITGFLTVGALCDAFATPLSAHCAPALHLHVGSAVPRLRHLEWFHDHVRIESLLFDGVAAPQAGCLEPDFSRLGHGLELKERDADHYAII